MKKIGFLFGLFIFGADSPARADWADTLNQYPCLEVEEFQADLNKKGGSDEMNAEVLKRLQKKIAAAVQESGAVQKVHPAGQSACSGKALLVGGEITQYKVGSAALRFTVGFGAGNHKIVAQTYLKDKQSGKTLLKSRIAESSKPGFTKGEPAVEKQFARNVAKFVQDGK